MGKVLRVLVVLIALLGLAALFFASKNYSKREALAGRAHALEEAVIRLAGTLEAEDLPDEQAPSYPERDISPVTSRDLATPERADFWSGYKAKLEGRGEPPPMLSYGSQAMRLQLRQYFKVGADGKYEINALTGSPSTEGAGTMDELLKRAQDRAKAQYNNLLATRSELSSVRAELVSTIEDLNRQKQSARADKRAIESLNGEVMRLGGEVRDISSKLTAANGKLTAAQAQVEELTDTNATLQENITELTARVEEQEQIIRELKGAGGGLKVVQTSDAPFQEGSLTPGDKGRIVSSNEEWKYAVIEFTPEFVTELIGENRDRALPACEVMVRRAEGGSPDEAFVTRLKLRQILKEKNLVIADILTDWQQKPVKVGDVVFN
ncbi:MAG: hypothetical protein ILM98_01105 [Kiritimatiellae bacterium]|nr:hypothetical protein [Kiritimatiellia bacterium]